jgi:hypothetical protein
MLNKTLHRNVIPATAIALAGSLTSQVERQTTGRGIRFYVTVTGVTTGGGTDALFLCAVPPSQTQGVTVTPASSVAIPLTGVSAVNAFSVAGTYCVDFYPGAWMPAAGLATGGALIGVLGVEVPMFWDVRIVLGTGNAATVTVDAELLP